MRNFRVVDALLLTFAAALTMAISDVIDQGAMTLSVGDRVRFHSRVFTSIACTLISGILLVGVTGDPPVWKRRFGNLGKQKAANLP